MPSNRQGSGNRRNASLRRPLTPHQPGGIRDNMLFGTWDALGRVLIVAPLAYCALVLLLRVSGKRTLTKQNAFDLVVTVALGSVLATMQLSKTASVAEGVLALAMLIGLQYVITWSSVRSERIFNLVTSEPTLLRHDGQFLNQAMLRQRVTREDLLAVLRNNGRTDPEEISGIVLENYGSFSVLSQGAPANILSRVQPADL